MKAVHPKQRSIVLASGSPRRRQLMRGIGFEPVIRVSSIPEKRRAGESPTEYARRLAAEKARDVASTIQGDRRLPGWILSADTIVVHGGEVLEKPEDEDDARSMLQRLSAEKHEVITAFCWLWRAPKGGPEERLEEIVDISSSVWLRELSDEMIERYVATGEPMDKAGSYGIQDVGGVLVRRNEGSYFCIVGLPVCEVVETLQGLGGLEGFPFGDEKGGDSE